MNRQTQRKPQLAVIIAAILAAAGRPQPDDNPYPAADERLAPRADAA